MPPHRVAVYPEIGPKTTLASALDWPGWCRAGCDEGAAHEALASYAQRYARVAEQAGVSLPSTLAFDVVARVPGGPLTAFAAPECRQPCLLEPGTQFHEGLRAVAHFVSDQAKSRATTPVVNIDDRSWRAVLVDHNELSGRHGSRYCLSFSEVRECCATRNEQHRIEGRQDNETSPQAFPSLVQAA
jgi:hypothetical protein